MGLRFGFFRDYFPTYFNPIKGGKHNINFDCYKTAIMNLLFFLANFTRERGSKFQYSAYRSVTSIAMLIRIIDGFSGDL
jgi:hypothetical protein